MNKCKKNILIIFVYLLITACLIVPYSSFSLDIVKDNSIKIDLGKAIEVPEPPAGFVLDDHNPRQSQSFHDFLQKEIAKDKKSIQNPNWYVYHHRGWIFSPYLLVSKKHFSIDENILTTEIAVILLAAGFSYILFCVVLKKGDK